MKTDVLGEHAKDKITGFEGTITGVVSYLTGCDQYLVQPTLGPNYEWREPMWLDSNRLKIDYTVEKLEITGALGVPDTITKDHNGPDKPAPIK